MVRFLFIEINRAISETGGCRFALAGGGTPVRLYERLSDPDRAGEVDWRRVSWYFGDERCVPPESDASNYRMVLNSLFATGAIPQDRLHRIPGELGPEAAAREYAVRIGKEPLDIILLGMGGDGHVASLFPDAPGLSEATHRVIATESPLAPIPRVTLSLAAINQASLVVLLVTGEEKADRLARVYAEIKAGAGRLPAARVQPVGGRLYWFVDAGAGGTIDFAAKNGFLD